MAGALIIEASLILARIAWLVASSPEAQRLAQQWLGQGKRWEDLTWEDCRMLTAQEIQEQVKHELAQENLASDPRQMSIDDVPHGAEAEAQQKIERIVREAHERKEQP